MSAHEEATVSSYTVDPTTRPEGCWLDEPLVWRIIFIPIALQCNPVLPLIVLCQDVHRWGTYSTSFHYLFDYKGVIAQTQLLDFPDCGTSLMDGWLMSNEPKPCTVLHQCWKDAQSTSQVCLFLRGSHSRQSKRTAYLALWAMQTMEAVFTLH